MRGVYAPHTDNADLQLLYRGGDEAFCSLKDKRMTIVKTFIGQM